MILGRIEWLLFGFNWKSKIVLSIIPLSIIYGKCFIKASRSSRKITTIRESRCQNICIVHPPLHLLGWAWIKKEATKKPPEKCQMEEFQLFIFWILGTGLVWTKGMCWSFFSGEGVEWPVTAVLCTIIKICELVILYSVCFFLLLSPLFSCFYSYYYCCSQSNYYFMTFIWLYEHACITLWTWKYRMVFILPNNTLRDLTHTPHVITLS